MVNLSIITVNVSIYWRKKLIVDNELTDTLIKSLKYFSIMAVKNVTETAHDEYIKWTNKLLRGVNRPDADHNHSSETDAFDRRGEDLDLLGHLCYEAS